MSNKITNFYDLDAWKQGHKLVLGVYEVTRTFPISEQFSITSQLRRAASSVTANIAEGFGRYHYKDKVRFFHQARGSLAEVQNFLILAKDLDYLTSDQCQELGQEANDVRRLINGLVRCNEVRQRAA
jgi:four helix bundle protein